MRRTQAGFTLFELLIAICVAAVLFTASAVMAGRFFVEDRDALRAAQDSGLVEAEVVERHNFFAGRSGCSSGDAVAFTVAGTAASGERETVTVCCGTWFHGCAARER
jgi:prepilin-type N-terminal cleavage/methylation domain-containing protein